MDEFRENGRLRCALDASLSGLNGDPYLARRLIAYAEKQPKAVRKRSIGLVFAFCRPADRSERCRGGGAQSF